MAVLGGGVAVGVAGQAMEETHNGGDSGDGGDMAVMVVRVRYSYRTLGDDGGDG